MLARVFWNKNNALRERKSRQRTYRIHWFDLFHFLRPIESVSDTATNSEINRCLKMSAETWRVKPSPNPPIRAMIPLTCADPRMVQDGRFTVLSYNILADLHATVLTLFVKRENYCVI